MEPFNPILYGNGISPRIAGTLTKEPNVFRRGRLEFTLKCGYTVEYKREPFSDDDFLGAHDTVERMVADGWQYDGLDSYDYQLCFTRDVPLTDEQRKEIEDELAGLPEDKGFTIKWRKPITEGDTSGTD